MSAVRAASVLVADRHQGLFHGIRGLLETTFDKVFLVTDRQSLMEGAARLSPTVIAVDVFYAAGDLNRLIQDLREQAPAGKVLLLSVYDESTVIESAIAAGADGLVVKRAIACDLMTAIDALLAGQRSFPSAKTV